MNMLISTEEPLCKQSAQRSDKCTHNAWPAERVTELAVFAQNADNLSKIDCTCSGAVKMAIGVKYKTLRNTWNESSAHERMYGKAFSNRA